MVVRSFSDLTTRVKRGARKTVAVVGADDAHALEAVLHAEPILDAVLIGEADAIRTTLTSLGADAERFPIVVPDAGEHPSVTAAKLFHAGRADFLMKGRITSGELLKGVLTPEANLRKGTLMSHVAFFELPGYPKLLCLTDGGMCPEPTLAEKEAIVRNAVEFFHGLGYECPNVAGLCGSETVHPKIRETVEAAALQKRAEEGAFGACRFVGPISYDLAMLPEVGKLKGYYTPLAGQFDILLTPNLVSGNLLGKSYIVNCGAPMAGLILGAKAPIVLTSRGASAEEKYNSLAIAAGAC